jgi:Na+/H+-dicarboxylate symporter
MNIIKKFSTLENLTLIGIILGILSGLYLKDLSIELKLVGNGFLNLLKMITIPLIFASLFVSITNLSSISDLKNLGGKAIVYYFSTTALAVFTGLLVVNLIGFGDGNYIEHSAQNHLNKEFSIESLINSFIPSNIIQSFAQGKVLHVIVFTILFAVSVFFIEEKKKQFLVNFMDSFNDSILVIAKWIIKLSPIGVFALIAYVVAEKGINTIFSLWHYVILVIIGLLFHAVFNLGLIGFIFGKFNPLKYFSKVKEAVLIAFSTSSSSATLPVSIQVAEEKAKIDKKVAGFVLPLGATINMDGTALYEAVAAMFIAHVYGIELSITQQIIIFITASVAAIGAAGIPSAGLVTMTLVFTAVGLPVEGIALILAVDRFLDMLRTSVNVWGDLVGTKIIDRFIK